MSERSYDDLPEAPVRVALSVPLSIPATIARASTPGRAATLVVPSRTPTSRGRHRAASVPSPTDHGPAETFRVGVLAAGAVFLALTVFLLVSNAWLH